MERRGCVLFSTLLTIVEKLLLGGNTLNLKAINQSPTSNQPFQFVKAVDMIEIKGSNILTLL